MHDYKGMVEALLTTNVSRKLGGANNKIIVEVSSAKINDDEQGKGILKIYANISREVAKFLMEKV